MYNKSQKYCILNFRNIRLDQDQSLYPHNHREIPMMTFVSDFCGTSLFTEAD